MNFLQGPPQWLSDLLPEGARGFLQGPGWYVVLAGVALVVLFVLWQVARGVLGGGGQKAKKNKDDLEIDLEAIGPAPPRTGDRRLHVEGTPARLRLVVVAPAGRAYDVNPKAIDHLLDRVLPGLGAIAAEDRPEVRVWPFMLSYEGFANQFHRNTPKPEGEDEPSRWVLAAGRAHIGKNQILLGLGLQSVKPNTVGRLRLDTHDWPNKLRIRTRD